jgi:hypothetical protein
MNDRRHTNVSHEDREAAEFRAFLESSVAPADAEHRRDLWPSMLRRIDERAKAKSIPWFDWALAAVVVAWLALYPGAIPILLYHL